MQVCPPEHVVGPQSSRLPQLSAALPQSKPRPAHVVAGSTSQLPPSPVPHRFGPPKPQVAPPPHLPQSTTPPHFVSVTKPQSAFSSAHVEGVQSPASVCIPLPGPQRLGPPPPQTSPGAHFVPHSTTPPHFLSVTKPQLAF